MLKILIWDSTSRGIYSLDGKENDKKNEYF